MSKYVNRVIAKLLKDKGYNLPCEFYWFEESTVSIPTRTQYRVENDWNSYTTNLRISAPFISNVVDWLLDKHGVYIHISPHGDNNTSFENCKWWFSLYKETLENLMAGSKMTSNIEDFNSKTEAELAAIEYTLKNLI